MTPDEVMAEVRRIEITTRHLVRDIVAGEYSSAFRGRGVEFSEVREYQPGDDVRTSTGMSPPGWGPRTSNGISKSGSSRSSS